MGFMVFTEKNRTIVVKFPLDLVSNPHLGLQPLRHGCPKRPNSFRCKADVGFQKAFKLAQGFVIESNIVELLSREAGCFQAICNRFSWKSGILFLASESFFLSSGYNVSVAQQAGRTVMIVCRNAKNVGTQRIGLMQSGNRTVC